MPQAAFQKGTADLSIMVQPYLPPAQRNCQPQRDRQAFHSDTRNANYLLNMILSNPLPCISRLTNTYQTPGFQTVSGRPGGYIVTHARKKDQPSTDASKSNVSTAVHIFDTSVSLSKHLHTILQALHHYCSVPGLPYHHDITMSPSVLPLFQYIGSIGI